MVRKVTTNTHWGNNGMKVWYAWTKGQGVGKPRHRYFYTFAEAIYYAQARARGITDEQALIDGPTES